ncbi:DUF2786 domain-containing protein [Cupriavidus sp. 30B13]|uniref:DUF2786 domain-containing protein n=1 Tax=Cupriavidus sp. 30B13 TaxID=3384241 RepID=UPI003B8F2B24
MDRNTVLDKIKKCLALAESDNPHEAAAAMRQAQKLMEMHGVSADELAAVDVEEAWGRSCATQRPPRYEVALVSMIASAFGCDLVFSTRVMGERFAGGYAFIGMGAAATIAQYTYGVLGRQLRKSRTTYIKTKLKRCGPKNKVSRADVFCEGWVHAVRSLVEDIAIPKASSLAIDAYMRANHAVTKTLTMTSRQPGRGVEAADDQWRGYQAGRGAVLHRGIDGVAMPALMLT